MKNKNTFIMKQPDLGRRITELRKQKGLTQEELVAQCNINVRTIQRIEAGEVNPRSYTIKIILEVLGEDLNDIQTESSTENNKITWTKDELKTINNSWIFGIFYAIITLVGIFMEIYFAANNLADILVLTTRIPFAILFFITLFPFMSGYKLIAKKFENTLLSNAILIYIIIAITMTIANFFTEGIGIVNTFEIVIGVFLMIIFGIGELIMGLGILKLKENLGSLAQITGIAKIINGALLISVILSPIALFFVVPILVLEVVFLHTTFKNDQNSLETKTEEAYSL
jgi:transcriptional regulator with XRE-family HTH domain